MSSSDDKRIEQIKRDMPRRDVSVVLLKDSNGRYLFVRTRRLPNHWQPIGGGVSEEDGSFEAAAVREVKEESGMSLSSDHLNFVFDAPYDFGEGTVRFFSADIATPNALTLDSEEIVEHRWLMVSEAQKLPMFPATAKCLVYMAEHSEIGREMTRRK